MSLDAAVDSVVTAGGDKLTNNFSCDCFICPGPGGKFLWVIV